MGNHILGGTGGEVVSKLENSHFPGKSEAIVPFLPWKPPFTHF